VAVACLVMTSTSTGPDDVSGGASTFTRLGPT
jgi:hypothetical protein